MNNCPLVKIKTKNKMKFTTYLFGNISEIEGKELIVIDRNPRGDHLCLDTTNSNIVDVDYRDIDQ